MNSAPQTHYRDLRSRVRQGNGRGSQEGIQGAEEEEQEERSDERRGRQGREGDRQ